MTRTNLISTGEAAKTIGVHATTLLRWWQDGKVIPAYVTPGKHARWDLDDLRDQLKQLTDQ